MYPYQGKIQQRRMNRYINPNQIPYQQNPYPVSSQNGYNPNMSMPVQYPFLQSQLGGQQVHGSFSNPYPIANQPIGKPAGGIQSILGQFKKDDGTYDMNKMMDTAGQMVGAVNQVGSMVKGLAKTFKG